MTVIPLITIDIAELPGHLPALLSERCVKHNVRLKIDKMEVGDFILSPEIRGERKEGEDFLTSLMQNRKLFRQIRDLANSCETPILVIEGKGYTKIFDKETKKTKTIQMDIRDALYTMSGMNPVALRGVLFSIQFDYGIHIIWTNSTEETCETLIHLAKREQTERRHTEYTDHASRKNMTLRQQREYIISAVENVGAVRARQLLKDHRTVERVFRANWDELVTDGVGEVTAKKIKKIVSTDHEE